MTESYIQQLFADRIGGKKYGKNSTLYKFEKIKRAKATAVQARPDLPLIDMGVGEPDDKAAPQVIAALHQAAGDPAYRGYADNGGMPFKHAVSRYMRKVFGVEINPENEIIHSIGSKSALSIIPACFINPGDVVLTTTPGYPIFGTHARYYGGEVYPLPLLEEQHFLPQLDRIPEALLERAKVLVINYPNNPTGASATLDFFAQAVEFAHRHHLIIVQDAAYAALTFSTSPLSILQIPRAKEVAIELHSLSKGFNMTGWRLGWVCGNPLIISAYADVKDNTDSGQFLAIQQAGITALEHPQITASSAAKYSRRMDSLIAILQQVGFPVRKPQAGFFLYCRAPRSASNRSTTITFSTADEFSQWLITENLISSVPWDDAGHYVRFSVTFEAADLAAEQRVISAVSQRLSTWHFQF